MSAFSASSVRVAVARRVGRGEELIEQRRVADDRPRVGQREQELGIVGLEAARLRAPRARDGRRSGPGPRAD